MDDDYIGLRVARYRDLAGLTQQQLADSIGYSRAYITQIENGLRPVTTRRLLIALAEGLGVPTTDLTAAPPARRPDPERPLHAAIPGIRAALDGASDPPPGPPGKATSDRLMSARMNCDYEALGALAPELLCGALHVAEISDQPTAYQQFAEVAFTMSMAVRPLGYVDLATRLAERAQWAASRADNPVTVAAAEFARAQCALAVGVRGLRQRSLTLATRAADQIQHLSGDDAITWYGLLHLQAALSAASMGRDSDADGHVAEAGEAAARVSGDPWRMEFTPANVGVWRVAVAVEGSDPTRAFEYAPRVDRSALRTPQRRAHLMIHWGRALYAASRREDAVAAFLEADAIAPAEVRGRSTVREAVGDMLRSHRRRAGSDDLRRLAATLGVDPLATEE